MRENTLCNIHKSKIGGSDFYRDPGQYGMLGILTVAAKQTNSPEIILANIGIIRNNLDHQGT